jgi:adenylate kinase
MKPKVFIFLGRSGAGKGTQAELLTNNLRENSGQTVIRVESGALLREYIKGETYTQKLIAEAVNNGVLVPEVSVVSAWTKYLADNFTGREIVIFDGCPRKIQEAYLLDSLLRFYKIEKPTVILIDVSDKWSTERLLERGRKDDSPEAIKKRLDWYNSEVKPSVDFFKNGSYYNFVEINGEQTIPEVHAEIVKKLGLE